MSFLSSHPPPKLGLPPKFATWRPTQDQAVEDFLDSDFGHHLCQAPVGIGKTLIGVAAALIDGGRLIYVTRTNLLMDQLLRDFSEIGLKLIRGRNNYACIQGGSCDDNATDCDFQQCPRHGFNCGTSCQGYGGDCKYKCDFKDAVNSKLVLTNYAFLARMNRWRSGLGECDILVLDEGHLAHQELSNALAFSMRPSDCQIVGIKAPEDFLSIPDWEAWSKDALGALASDRSAIGPRLAEGYSQARARLAYERLHDRVDFLSQLHGRWLVEPTKHAWDFHPVRPREHAHRYLFAGAEKVLVMSATATKKSMALLGLKSGGYSVRTYPYQFPRQHFPIYAVVPRTREGKKGFKVSYKLFHDSDRADELQEWLELIYQALLARRDRKGIIHCVSYALQQTLLAYIEGRDPDLAGQIYAPKSSETALMVEQYRESEGPVFILSPSLTTGYDFPGRECEFVLIPKLPFVPTKSRLMQARLADDPLYDGYVMVQDLIQATGRGTRSKDDRCETIIFDANWLRVRYRYKVFFPLWFKVRTRDTLPDPPKTIAQIRDLAQSSGAGSPIVQ